MRGSAPNNNRSSESPPGLFYQSGFLTSSERLWLLNWLLNVHPIWEERYSEHHPPPVGRENRPLLRPVYWLGNWQFACLDYYHPPKGILNRCVRAEPFPDVMQAFLERAAKMARENFAPEDFPAKWKWNTCLVNMYGGKFEAGKWTDAARVGEHRDFEPGPVASISLGERALFQFVTGKSRDGRAEVVKQQWLEDRSLQMFSGKYWKDKLFHRVQRVDRQTDEEFGIPVEGFRTRRVNLTFRYVPEEHIVSFKDLPENTKQDLRSYVSLLAAHSSFWRDALG